MIHLGLIVIIGVTHPCFPSLRASPQWLDLHLCWALSLVCRTGTDEHKEEGQAGEKLENNRGVVTQTSDSRQDQCCLAQDVLGGHASSKHSKTGAGSDDDTRNGKSVEKGTENRGGRLSYRSVSVVLLEKFGMLTFT